MARSVVDDGTSGCGYLFRRGPEKPQIAIMRENTTELSAVASAGMQCDKARARGRSAADYYADSQYDRWRIYHHPA